MYLNKYPESQIIVFDQQLNLPQFYSKTPGSVGSRLATNWALESELQINDRLVSYIEGQETIKNEPPPPHLRGKVKEIEIRERDDLVSRKISLKNLSDKPMNGVKVILAETKEVRFDSSAIEPEKDPPEVRWIIDIPPDKTTAVEFSVKIHQTKTFEIERDREGGRDHDKNHEINRSQEYSNANFEFRQTEDDESSEE